MSVPDRQIDMIFRSLESAGFPRSLQNILLPEWVTPEVLSDATVSSEIATILAKRLGLRASPLFAVNPRVESLERRDIKYKRSIPKKSKNLTAATSIAISVAESVASACRVEFSLFAGSADALRQDVLGSFPGKWLGLRNLLMSCWSHGVPVVYLAELGQGVVKMDGMVVHTGDRPVIILSKVSPLWAWQLFILAHEIAHIVLGHVLPGEILVDEELSEDSSISKDNDLDERAADMFAIELLNGRQKATYTLANQANFRELADTAYDFGKANQIDPGHIVLNFANQSGKWGIGIAAAKLLQGDNPPASAVIGEAMWGGIEPEALPTDTIEFLVRVTDSGNELDKVAGSYVAFR
ncbi:ImmA/IrrE family metallo-endopeptidase [Limnofasciculus baicalensis]|uniref:ImmA/IrrE family metallo-endopeptidase n=1 Tax=Limnofasciculus baicalensis BBK-W-15 TaxID=2699891 RepID=A0AAE3GTP4_9CYAN|nr:ImmA/IrrE family metallo-endopeptidase [Limnofasciculus baicalensis]MCP2729698.1 ImmA/IrrE family metallo-endopeptidase [Limnofasciculus baicalensis BBK-W-15]